MPTAADRAPLEELPMTTRELARATLRAGRTLVRASVARRSSQPGPPRALLAIRRTSLQLHFFIARSGEEIIFFFFKKQLGTIRPLEAQLQISLCVRQELPATNTPPAVATTGAAPAESCSYRLVAPPFLKLRPTAAELAIYAPDGTTVESGVLLYIGPQGRHVLGILNPEAGSRAAALYTTPTRQALTGWPAEPFLELTETLRAWLADTQSNDPEVNLAIPTDPSAMSDVHATLYWFVAAYRSVEAEQKAASAEPLPPPLATIVPSYGLEEYTADIALCVDRTGRFATAKERQPVSLALHLEVRRELGALVARIKLSPPDFLASGALRATFLAKLRSGTPSATLKSIGMPQVALWSEFLDSATERAVVLRTSRDITSDTDTDVVVLPGTWQGRARTLILQTQAKVDVKAQPVHVALLAVALRYDSQASTKALLDDDTVTYFMRLAAALKHWLAVLR